MAQSPEQSSRAIKVNEVEMHLEAVQNLVKSHGNPDSVLTISSYIEKIRQVINEENLNFQSSPSSLVQKNMMNTANEVSVIDSDLCEKALNNSVVLRTIMSHLSAQDLFRMRLVSKKWEEEATIKILATQSWKEIKFGWDAKELKFRHKLGTLEEFTNSCFSDPLRKFPCSRFGFKNVTTNLEITEVPSDLSNFLSKNGHHVKSLRLKSSRNSAAALNIVRTIIFELTPCLKSLTLDVDLYKIEPSVPGILTRSKSSSHNSLKSSWSKKSLEYLEEFACNSKYDDRSHNSIAAERRALLIGDILSSAPNLKQISDPALLFTKEIQTAGKIGAVHYLQMNLYSEDMMSRYAEFSQARPQLTDLEVDLQRSINGTNINQRNLPSSFASSLQLILQSSRESMQTLEITGRIDLLVGTSRVRIPIMKNLQYFRVQCWSFKMDDGRGKLLPPGFSLQKSFPNLKRLSIDGISHDEDYCGMDNPFGESCNSSSTVEDLSIYPEHCGDSCFKADWLSQTRVLYPNVRSLLLDIPDHEELPKIFGAIWKSWKDSGLEELSVTTSFPDEDEYFYGYFGDDVREQEDKERNEKFAGLMDQALTGFDEKSCGILQKQRSSENCQENEGFERVPSICDMKKLKSFRLHTPYNFPSFPIFSRISVIHAFEPMRKRQNLGVEINGIDLAEMLQVDVDFSVCRE